MRFESSKCIKMHLQPKLHPDPAGGAYSISSPLAGIVEKKEKRKKRDKKRKEIGQTPLSKNIIKIVFNMTTLNCNN